MSVWEVFISDCKISHPTPNEGLAHKTVAFMGIFAAFHATLYLISPPVLWRNWAIYLGPIEGIVLCPWSGFISALIGSIIGRVILPTPLWMFGIVSESLSVLAAGFLVESKWQSVVAIYAAMFLAYFISPLGRSLPIWALTDTIIAVFLVYSAAKISNNFFHEGKALALVPSRCIFHNCCNGRPG